MLVRSAELISSKLTQNEDAPGMIAPKPERQMPFGVARAVLLSVIAPVARSIA
jgi:hypothetical protein